MLTRKLSTHLPCSLEHSDQIAMADSEVAARAPESDAQENIPLNSPTSPKPTPEEQATHKSTPMSADDTIAQTGPSMGDHCVSDRPLSDASPTLGEIAPLNGIQTYISKPPQYPTEPGKLLLLLTSGTGIHSQNNQHQADAYAARGFLVIMPDQFNGDPAPNTAAVPAAASEQSLLERVKVGVVETAKSFTIDMWLARHTPETVLPALQKALEGAREQFGDAVANGGGIYGAGYCFGAKYILLLLGSQPDSVTWGQKQPGEDPEKGEAVVEPMLKCGAIAHGTMVTQEDIAGVSKPVSMACVKDDALFPDEVRENGVKGLGERGVAHEVRVFEGVPHGFAVLGDFRDANIQTKQTEAFEMMSRWLEQH